MANNVNDVKTQLIEILSSYGYPVRLQGSFAPNEPYPQTFITFWNGSTYGEHHYDNRPTFYSWYFSIYCYSTDPEIVNTLLLQAKTDLEQAGWIVAGKGYDADSGEPTHTGRGLDIIFMEREDSSI